MYKLFLLNKKNRFFSKNVFFKKIKLHVTLNYYIVNTYFFLHLFFYRKILTMQLKFYFYIINISGEV